MSRREIIIESLHGDMSKFIELPEQLRQLGVFKEDGYVDDELMLAVLSLASVLESVTVEILSVLNESLGPVPVYVDKKQFNDNNGVVWSAEKILAECTLEDNVIRLPQVQLHKKAYLEVKNRIQEAGGSWNGRLNGFTFDFDAHRVFDILKSGKRCDLKQEYQYFATPDAVADIAVGKFSSLDTGCRVLEPSAGRGSLVKAVRRRCPDLIVDCYELMPENVEHLEKVDGVRIIGKDFCECHDKYDRIIANPPFSNNQDIDHVYMMYERLNVGGELSCIVSQHWKIGKDRKCTHFREWLKKNDAEVIDLEKGEFKESGTNVGTALIFLRKDPQVGEQASLF